MSFTSIDEQTGKSVQIGQGIPYESIAQGLTSIDSANGIAYVLGINGVSRAVGAMSMTNPGHNPNPNPNPNPVPDGHEMQPGWCGY